MHEHPAGRAAGNVVDDSKVSEPAKTLSSGLSATFSPFQGEKGLRESAHNTATNPSRRCQPTERLDNSKSQKIGDDGIGDEQTFASQAQVIIVMLKQTCRLMSLDGVSGKLLQ